MTLKALQFSKRRVLCSCTDFHDTALAASRWFSDIIYYLKRLVSRLPFFQNWIPSSWFKKKRCFLLKNSQINSSLLRQQNKFNYTHFFRIHSQTVYLNTHKQNSLFSLGPVIKCLVFFFGQNCYRFKRNNRFINSEVYKLNCGWRGGLMVSALYSGSNGPGSSLGQGTALRS